MPPILRIARSLFPARIAHPCVATVVASASLSAVVASSAADSSLTEPPAVDRKSVV